MARLLRLAAASLLVGAVRADLYMHHPRGSNNKLNEPQNNVADNERLFDSQNNNAGGYQVGDDCFPLCHTGNNYDRTLPGAAKGQMYYYEGSYLPIEWTNQHGCGNAQKNVKCELIMQYMCEDTSPGLRDGTLTGNNNAGRVPLSEAGEADPKYGLHEPLSWYKNCMARERNKGLYVADQNLNNRNSALSTRQDPNDNVNNDRHGFECPEERDYYPYWHPNPWRDIAVFTDDQSRCAYYQQESQNVRGFGMCCNSTKWALDQVCEQQEGDTTDDNRNDRTKGPNNPVACASSQAFSGTWVEFDSFNTWPPLCERTPYSRDNHLGNSVPKADEAKGLSATNQAPTFMWEIPPDVLDKLGKDEATCVLRLRYNISTTDYDAWEGVTSTSNGGNAYPQNDPRGDFLGFNEAHGTEYPLEINLNTAQYGRTFQDRSHTFKIKRRSLAGACANRRIHNLNVRGRRGNIVEVYPAVEYDFVPTTLTALEGECIHFQWAGSDANSRGNNGANGLRGTDRTNIVEIGPLGKNMPLKHDYKAAAIDYNNLKHWSMFEDEATVIKFAYLDQEKNCSSGTCVPTNYCDDNEQNDQAKDNCGQLNAASAYFDAGPLVMNRAGTFNYMSTRNNDFSNRSQKATIVIRPWIAGVVVASLSGFILLLLAVFWFCQRRAQFDPSHRLHKNRCGRCLVSCGHNMTKFYERTFFHYAPFTCFLIASVGILFGIGYHYATLPGGDPAPLYPWAKGFGRVLDVTCNLIFLPVLRNWISWLRTTPMMNVLPLGEDIYFHKLTAVLIAIPAAGHIAAHYYDYWWHDLYGSGRNIYESALLNWTGISGHFIFLFMFLMFFTALDKVRRRKWKICGFKFGGYSLFVRVHKLWIPVLILLWSHSRAFWHYSLCPTVLLILDRLIARMRGKRPIELVSATTPTRDVMGLNMRLKSHRKFRYKSGQYLFLHCPAISTTEWHPFTISSSPEERVFSVHIRCRSDMDWTYALKSAIFPSPEQKKMIDVARERIKKKEKEEDAKLNVAINKEVTRRNNRLEKKKEEPVHFSWLTSMFNGDSFNDGANGANVSTPLEEARKMAMGNGANGGKSNGNGNADAVYANNQYSAKPGARAKIQDLDGKSPPPSPPTEAIEEETEGEETEVEEAGMQDDEDVEELGLSSALIEGPYRRRAGGPDVPSPPPSPPTNLEISDADGNPLELFVDGPYGTASEEVFGFEVLVLVGAGIGVTPFASILKTLAIQSKQDRLETPLKKVSFYWVCRDDKEFETFRDLLTSIVDDRSLTGIFELNTYTTGELDRKKDNASMYGYNQFSGKPDWNRIGRDLKNTYPSNDIGVFLCGPPAIGTQLAAMCKKFNPPKIPGQKMKKQQFYFFKENF